VPCCFATTVSCLRCGNTGNKIVQLVVQHFQIVALQVAKQCFSYYHRPCNLSCNKLNFRSFVAGCKNLLHEVERASTVPPKSIATAKNRNCVYFAVCGLRPVCGAKRNRKTKWRPNSLKTEHRKLRFLLEVFLRFHCSCASCVNCE